MSTPKSVSELFPSRWLRADDLGGKAFVLKIDHVTIETVRDVYTKTDVEKGVVWFVGAQKGLVLNHTQATQIAQILKTDLFSDWTGKQISLRPATARNGKPTIVIDAVRNEMV